MEINGKHTKLPEGTTILDYLEQNHYVLAQIAVEHNYVILEMQMIADDKFENSPQRRLCKSCFEG